MLTENNYQEKVVEITLTWNKQNFKWEVGIRQKAAYMKRK